MAVFFAAACGVPTALVSGDTATCKEAIDLLGHVETASTVTVEIDMVNPKMIPWWTAVPTVEEQRRLLEEEREVPESETFFR